MMKYPTRGDIIQIRSYRLDQIHNSRCVSNVNNNGFRSNHKQQNRKIKSKYVNNLLNDKIRCNERRNISCFSFEAVAPRRTYDKGLFEVENHKLIIDATYGNIVLLFIFLCACICDFLHFIRCVLYVFYGSLLTKYQRFISN